MKKLICLVAAVSMLGLTACAIDSQGYYVTKDAQEKQAQENAAAVIGQGIIEDHGSSTELYGCDTFTDILNMKYTFGSGYANTTLDGTDVLLLSDGLFDAGNGRGAAVNSELYCYKNGRPSYLGYVRTGGTATPLSVRDGKLYACGHHYIAKITVTNGRLVTMEEAWQTFDDKGNVSYHYSSGDGGDYSKVSSDEAETVFDDLYTEYMEAEVVTFDIVKPGAYGELKREVSIDYGNSTLYSREDMDEAIDEIKDTIGDWDGCELHAVRYAGDNAATEENLEWINGMGMGDDYTEVIEFLTDFHGPEEVYGAWEKDTEYTDFQWWFARKDGGWWELMTWGY